MYSQQAIEEEEVDTKCKSFCSVNESRLLIQLTVVEIADFIIVVISLKLRDISITITSHNCRMWKI